ncbi:MAG: CRTAC1 family protein [Myxococcales bacterium]|nr:CRTAC1 family protein [Myxococcales bacterium]
MGVFHTVCSWQTSSAVAQPLIKFVNVANDAGITLVVDQAPPQTGAGMAVIDTDKDGLPDLILSGGFKLPVTLFRNLGGMKFQLVPGNVSGLGFFGTDSRGFAAGDYDNDGDRDLFVANWTSDENSALLRNDNGKFVDVTPSSGIVVAGNATGASWTDYDGDGCLDLYVSRYWWSENKLFKGNCTGEFIDNTSISGLATPAGTKNTTQSFQSVWFDADWDGDQDLYLMNDRCYVGMRRNEFFLNNGNGTFTEAAGEWGLDLCFDAMGIALTDFDGNGHLDMFMTNTQEGHVFAHASCDGYVDKAKDIGLLMHKWGWAVLTEDFNFDGWPDLYVANAGYAKPAVGGNVLFANKGDGSLTFVDMTDLADNADSPIGNTGLVRADFDADGDIDVIVGKVMAQPFSVLRNDSITGNYLTIRLQGTQSNRDGIGAVVDVIAGGRLRRQIRYESSVYNGSNDNSLVFGLGEIDKITRISIRWPSGTVQWIDEPAVNQILTVVESETPGAQSTFGLEICGDAYDNDCDGTADLEFGPVGSTCSVGVGECQTTSTLVCTADLLDMTCPIQAAAPVSGEIEADGLDNDCDGVIDEKEEEQPERPTPLRGRPVGDPLPPCANTFEKCGDGVDNDCDGLIDEGFGIGSQCQVIVGTCSLIGVTICAESGDATACKLANLQFGPELCGDEIDNDCDGEIDEGFDVGAPCVVQIHGCTLEGVFECTESGMSATCVILENNPSVELCGDGKDNDCDGEVDEGFHTGDLCASYVNDCLVAGEMRCSDNRLTEACDIGHFVPPAELCGDNIDNDCDGQTDEGFEVVGGKCWLGEGVCTRKGKWLCTADLLGYFCDAAVGTVSEEVMGDGFDNDCDGLIDENDSPNRLPTMYESLEVITDNHFVTKDIDHPQADSNDTTSTPGSGCNSGVVDGKYHQWMVFGLLVLILCLRRVGSKLLKFIC